MIRRGRDAGVPSLWRRFQSGIPASRVGSLAAMAALGLIAFVAIISLLYVVMSLLLGYDGITPYYSSLAGVLFVLLILGIMAVGGILVAMALWRRVRSRVRTRIRTKLTLSHILVVALSLIVFSALMSILYLWILSTAGYDVTTQFYQFLAMTAVVLVVIAIITGCSIVVAMIASRFVSRRLTRQIVELEQATESIAAGQLDKRVSVLSQDELGSLAVRFNRLAERLEELDQQRRSFVASISHDLRTPLAIIRGHVDAQVREPDDETPTHADAFRAIEHEAITLGKLVDDLFTLSRLEEAALPMEREPIDLAEIIEDAVLGMRPYALKVSRVSVNAMVPESLPSVLGDGTRTTQILNNLLHNAVRHTPEGGIVIVEASVDLDGRNIALSVRDTGVGISPEALPHIFDRFYQGDSVRSGGAGLGLSIVKQLVEIQGGTVTAASTPGEGTTITVTLPVATMSASRAAHGTHT